MIDKSRKNYFEVMQAHVDEGGQLSHRNGVDLLAELTRLQERLAAAEKMARDNAVIALKVQAEFLASESALDAEKASGERLRELLREARQYVDDAGYYEDPEAQRNSGILLTEIDAALSGKAGEGEKPKWRCFHCDTVFTDRDKAEEHFGTRQHDAPLCAADQFELVATRKERDEYADMRAKLIGELDAARRTAPDQQSARDAVLALVSRQAENEGLWFRAETITEDYLQRALRELHATIEHDARALSALRSGAKEG